MLSALDLWPCPPLLRRLSSNTAVVVSVRADPIPDDDGTIENTQGAVAESDTNGIDVFRLFYFLEAKAQVTRISAEKPVGLPRLSLNFIWQGSKCGSEGARGARLNHNSSSRGRVSPRRCSCRA